MSRTAIAAPPPERPLTFTYTSLAKAANGRDRLRRIKATAIVRVEGGVHFGKELEEKAEVWVAGQIAAEFRGKGALRQAEGYWQERFR